MAITQSSVMLEHGPAGSVDVSLSAISAQSLISAASI
tara:strand:- start:525 stop:635 length:111 start_codon:yes stop_codon:yes gene_type:complete